MYDPYGVVWQTHKTAWIKSVYKRLWRLFDAGEITKASGLRFSKKEKNMKKRLVAGLLAGTMAMAMMAGCGSSSSGSTAAASDAKETASGSTAAAPSGDAKYNMTLVMSVRDEFRSSVEQAISSQAAEYGVSFAAQDANNDTNKMLQYIEASANGGDDAVIVNLIDSETAPQCIEAAGDMKVVFVNIAPSDLSCLNENACMVASDNLEAGQRQGEYLAQWCKDNDKTELNYILLKGTLGLIHSEQRSDGVIDTLEANGIKCNNVAGNPLVADFDRATAQDMISPLLGVEEFDAIIANNDAMALGAVEALKAAGMDPKDYQIVGVDCTADGAEAIENGDMSMTVFQDPQGQGSGSLQAAVNMLEGKPINEGTNYELAEDNEYVMWVPFETVTADNVADFK